MVPIMHLQTGQRLRIPREEVPSVTGGDTDSLQGSDSRPLTRQGTVTAALRLI